MNFIDSQLFKVAPFPINQESTASHLNGQFSIKIHSARGSTVWLDISPSQLKRIELILSEIDQEVKA
jgi:hypothetical protein